VRITSKGQVTIPARIREEAGLMPNTEVEFAFDGKGQVRLFRAGKSRAKRPGRGERIVARLKGSGDVKMTTDEIMKLTRGD
jgi:AbrB family looped-hinge helix DNA binding protein